MGDSGVGAVEHDTRPLALVVWAVVGCLILGHGGALGLRDIYTSTSREDRDPTWTWWHCMVVWGDIPRVIPPRVSILGSESKKLRIVRDESTVNLQHA